MKECMKKSQGCFSEAEKKSNKKFSETTLANDQKERDKMLRDAIFLVIRLTKEILELLTVK